MASARRASAPPPAAAALPSLAEAGPMLARLARALPEGDYLYEPKWDGFRVLAFAGGPAPADIDLRSRHGRPLARYFPEVVAALAALAPHPLVLDGELVVAAPGGFDFAALLGRIHPAASRVERLRRDAPATFIAFDLLAAGARTLLDAPFAERRAALQGLWPRPAPAGLALTPATDDAAVARRWLTTFHGRGIDGVVAKARALTYQPGRRAMIKVKHEETADCVVAGVRAVIDDDGVPATASLLLGLYDGGLLRHVGVASSFTAEARRALVSLWRPLIAPAQGHPWEQGFHLRRSPMGRLPGSAGRWDAAEMARDWIPLAPRLVCEVTYDQLDGARFRHPARFVRWRPDREALSCTFDQLAPGAAPGAELFAP